MSGTPKDIGHHVIAADGWLVPKPFRSFAVRSEEPRHAATARAPYQRVHAIRTGLVHAGAAARLAADGRARMPLAAPFDIQHAQVTPAALAAAAPGVDGLADRIAAMLQTTGVLGSDMADYRRSVAARIDYLATRGAGFHNDVSRHWTACLFWNLAIVAADVEFVMPHAGVRIALQPGDLLVFDQTMAHGLCRPRDQGQAVAASFAHGDSCRQLFLTGELPLTDAQWAALGSPWLPVEQHGALGALDLVAAEFDERSGAIKSLRSLARCMSPGTSYVS